MDVEKHRLNWGGGIIIASMMAMLAALAIIFKFAPAPDGNVARNLALIGGVTTFLSAVVGVFFGVSAGTSSSVQSNQAAVAAGLAGADAAAAAKTAAAASDQAAAASSSAASAAQDVAATARQVADAATRSLDQARQMVLAPRSALAVPGSAAEDDDVEVLRFDPGAPATTLAVPRGLGQFLEHFFAPRPGPAAPSGGAALFQQVLDVARAEAAAGVSRSTDRARVTEYLALLGLPFAEPGGKPVPFCAAGVTWAACRAYCDVNRIAYSDANRLAVFRGVLGEIANSFKPSASCKAILADARARGTFVDTPKSGYLVLYNWSGGSQPEHVGLVVGATETTLSTVEFNTSAAGSQSDGGAVALKSRNRRHAIGYVRTYPDASGSREPVGGDALAAAIADFAARSAGLLGAEAPRALAATMAKGDPDPAVALPLVADLVDMLPDGAPDDLRRDGEALIAGLRSDASAREPVDATGARAVAPTFETLREEYLTLFASCTIRPAYKSQVAWHVAKIEAGKTAYQAVENATGVPWAFVAIVHGLEASFRFNGHLHNGDPLTARTVHDPAGRPPLWNPPNDWQSSAVDALVYENFAGLADWSLPRMLYRWERYNGFGSRRQGIHTPYLWSFSNHYTKGKYVADHVWDPEKVSKQCGAAVMLRTLVDKGVIPLPPQA